ncbi:hypothetical protein FRC07_000537 [Ceratobasidium sp. 392]|nr:hypothetical protein FRC07_000537 [Ceratobasidium sp. 392]
MSQSKTEQTKARKQAQRVARREKSDRVNIALLELQEKTHELLEAAAKELEFDVDNLRRLFLANSTAHIKAKPTAWNGLMHEKSKEWINMKVAHPGSKYIEYVVQRIQDEGLYNNMSKEDEDRYAEIAQKLRDSKLSVGSARTATHRKTPGNVHTELESMGQRMLHLHNITGIEGIFIAVRGDEKDGMSPVYISSPKARTFFENYLKVDSDHFVTLLECASIGGASAVANHHRTETQVVKTSVRTALLKSLRTYIFHLMYIHTDGSPPVIDDPSTISSISYKDYASCVDRYKVEVFNWPMKGESMQDPSDVGGLKILSSYLKLIESGQSGFRRLTAAQWDAWKAARDDTVVIPTKRKRSRPTATTEQQSSNKKTRKESNKSKSKSKSKTKAKTKVVGTTSEDATDANSSETRLNDTELEPTPPDDNNFSPPVSPLPPIAVPAPSLTAGSVVPLSPPIDERYRITITRRPTTPATPATLMSSEPASPTFPVFPVSRQPNHAGGLFDTPQTSPARGRRSFDNSWDRPFINHTPDSISSGQRASRSTSPALRANSPARRTRPRNSSHAPATASPLTSTPTGRDTPSSLANQAADTSDDYLLTSLQALTPPPFGFGPSNDWMGADNLGDQSPALSAGWGFNGSHVDLVSSSPEAHSTTSALSEFASPDA